MTETRKQPAKGVASELIVPAMMLLFVGIYWVDAAGLSAEALAFPMALTSIIALATLVVVATAIISANKTKPGNTENIEGGRVDVVLSVKIWLIVLMPIPLVYFWQDLGATVIFFLYATGVSFFLGERRALWLVLVPSILAVGLVYLFKTFLYVRLPDIPWIFGG